MLRSNYPVTTSCYILLLPGDEEIPRPLPLFSASLLFFFFSFFLEYFFRNNYRIAYQESRVNCFSKIILEVFFFCRWFDKEISRTRLDPIFHPLSKYSNFLSNLIYEQCNNRGRNSRIYRSCRINTDRFDQ